MSNRSRAAAAGLGAVALALAVATAAAAAAPKPRRAACPAPPGSAEPALWAGAHGLYASWIAPLADGRKALQYAVQRRGRWSEVRTIVAGPDLLANWADFPSLVELDDGSLVAQWLVENPAAEHAYDAVVARSRDGLGWTPGVRPYADASPTEHGFVSLAPGPGGACTVVWLDGRGYAGKSADDSTAEMRLMSAGLGADGAGPEVQLDARVCDCCQTAAVRTARGVLVAYRDRGPDETRDHALVRFEAGRWSEPYPLGHDGWRISGCPVNGPALAAAGDRVVAAWFTMRDGQPLVQAALSRDGGAQFAAPVRVAEGGCLGRVDVAVLPSGDALVVWMENVEGGRAEIRACRLTGAGGLDPAFTVAATSADRASGFPHVALHDGALWFAWTETGASKQVRMARLELPKAWRGAGR